VLVEAWVPTCAGMARKVIAGSWPCSLKPI